MSVQGNDSRMLAISVPTKKGESIYLLKFYT